MLVVFLPHVFNCVQLPFRPLMYEVERVSYRERDEWRIVRWVYSPLLPDSNTATHSLPAARERATLAAHKHITQCNIVASHYSILVLDRTAVQGIAAVQWDHTKGSQLTAPIRA